MGNKNKNNEKFREEFVKLYGEYRISTAPIWIEDREKLWSFIESTITKVKEEERQRLIEKIMKESGQYFHSEFCRKKGKQFKPCLICILQKLSRKG